jgi:hypothetical protein
MASIAPGKIGNGERPGNAEHRVVVEQPAFSVGSVEGGVQVEQFAVRLDDLKAMGEAFGDNHHAHIGQREFFRMPAQEGWRVLAQINGNIPYPPLQAANQLHFSMWRVLKMQAANSADLGSARVVELHHVAVANHSGQFPFAIKAGEGTSCIGMRRSFDHHEAWDIGRQNVHGLAHSMLARAAEVT